MLKAVGIIITVIVLVAAAYIVYIFADYHRLEDNLKLAVTAGAEGKEAAAGVQYEAMSWNIGFAAYSADYTFFMDGGKYSRAYSEEVVYENLSGILGTMKEYDPDFLLVQEVDLDSTRSYHVDERTVLLSEISGYDSVFAVNYDSPYLFYPILSPHGSSNSCMMTLSRFGVSDSIRRSLPVESGVMKFLDLDRCYSVTRVPVENGKELCLYNIHLSAYTSDGTIATEQFKIVLEDMEKEYSSGNYIVCGGDFNKDILGDSPDIFGVSGEDYTWALPLDTSLIPDGFELIAPLDESSPIPSCRNPDIPYTPGVSFVVTADGFIVSDNVKVTHSEVIDAGFAYSDHNPVYITFVLS